MPSQPPDAIILFAHGSRDPLWRAPIEAVAQRINQQSTQQHPQALARCAYLELCEPDLPTVATEVIAARAEFTRVNDLNSIIKVRIVPMFLGMGKHAREDLPELVVALRAAHPNVQFEVVAAIGEDARVTALLADMAVSSSH
jgi:sirohydrochlorin cobaltochelatase